MSGSIPQWILDIESDEVIYKNKRVWSLICLIGLLILFILFATKFGDNPLNRIIISVITFVLLFIIMVQVVSQKQNSPNLLAANLYRIGTELETFDSSSPSYIKRNQQYLKNCQNILGDLMVQKSYFIKDYITFLKNIGNIIFRLNYFYSNNLKPTNSSISPDLIGLADKIHENNYNILPVHTEYVKGIVSNLETIEPHPLNTSFINKWVKSFITGWHNLQEPYRKVVTYLVIFITIFSVSSLVMFYLGMEKTNSIGYAFLGTSTLVGFSIKLN